MEHSDQSDPEPVRELDWTAVGRPSHAVVTAMADVRDVDPVELEPLYHDVDLEALDALCDRDRDGDCTISFRRGAYEVVIESDGSCSIYGQDESPVDADEEGEAHSATTD